RHRSGHPATGRHGGRRDRPRAGSSTLGSDDRHRRWPGPAPADISGQEAHVQPSSRRNSTVAGRLPVTASRPRRSAYDRARSPRRSSTRVPREAVTVTSGSAPGGGGSESRRRFSDPPEEGRAATSRPIVPSASLISADHDESPSSDRDMSARSAPRSNRRGGPNASASAQSPTPKRASSWITGPSSRPRAVSA